MTERIQIKTIACDFDVLQYTTHIYLMQVPSILHRANHIVSAMYHCGRDVAYFVQIVHDPPIMVKPSTMDKIMAVYKAIG